MLETSARLLRLLSLLQTRRDWTGPQLAERLGVTTPPIRNDIERPPRLGYPADATPRARRGFRLRGRGPPPPPRPPPVPAPPVRTRPAAAARRARARRRHP